MREQLIKTTDVQQLINHCKHNLDLMNTKLSDEFFYASLPFCVIDAVFSVGVRYESTRRVVMRFCDHFHLQRIHNDSISTLELSITGFLEMYDKCSPQCMADNIYQNKQRTSSRNGILKAEATLRVAQTLKNAGVEFKADVFKTDDRANFEAEFKEIPGQGSGKSLHYFYMLAGSDDDVALNNMVLRFIASAIGREPTLDEGYQLLADTCKELKQQYRDLTLRKLDHSIWNFQREQ